MAINPNIALSGRGYGGLDLYGAYQQGKQNRLANQLYEARSKAYDARAQEVADNRRENALASQLTQAAASGDSQAMNKLVAIDPSRAKALSEAQSQQRTISAENEARTLLQIQGYLQNGDTQTAAQLAQGLDDDPGKAHLMQSLQQGNADSALQLVSQGVDMATRTGVLKAAPEGQQLPSSVREYEYAQKNPGFADYQNQRAAAGRSNTSINVSTGGKPFPYPIPKNYMPADLSNPSAGVVPIPGGPDDPAQMAKEETAKGEAKLSVEQQKALPKSRQSLQSYDNDTDRVIGNIDRLMSRIDNFSAGLLGASFSSIPGTEARDVRAQLDTIKANVGFQQLNEMRQNSPTGGALGQVTEREIAFLQALLGNLEQSQSPQQLRDNLVRVKQQLQQSKERLRQGFITEYGEQQMPSGGQAKTVNFEDLD